MGLAYRELIGSLYESWTIGIGRVYKLLRMRSQELSKKGSFEGNKSKEKRIEIGELVNEKARCLLF